MGRNRYLVALLALLLAGPAIAQSDFPNRRVHVLVPYPAGGIVDIATRIVTDKLAELLAPALRGRGEAGRQRQRRLGPGGTR